MASPTSPLTVRRRGALGLGSWVRGSGTDGDLRHSDPDFHRSVSQTSFSLQEPGETEKADRYRVRPKSGRKQKPQRSMTYRVWKCIALIVMLAILLTGAILVMLRFRCKYFFFSTGLVQLYSAGLPLRSCRTIGALSVQGALPFVQFFVGLQWDSKLRPSDYQTDALPPDHAGIIIARFRCECCHCQVQV